MPKSPHFLILALLLPIHYLMDYSSAKTDINTDRSSLLALKSQITLDPQNILTQNWSTEASVCSWIGVTCDSRYNRVTQLNISSMGLVGTLPPEIGNLSSLVSLDVNENSFHGPIPPSIFNMSFLEVLEVRNNSLSSSLPLDMCIHKLHRLKRLRLSYNEMYGEIPSSLGQCSQLEFLSLYNNNFTGFVPREIANLTKLQVLNLGANNLRGNLGLCGVPLTIKCNEENEQRMQPEKVSSTNTPPQRNVESDREIEWDYVFAAAGYVVGIGSFSWVLLFCPSFRDQYFERVEDVFEKIFKRRQNRKRRHGGRRVVRNQVRRQ